MDERTKEPESRMQTEAATAPCRLVFSSREPLTLTSPLCVASGTLGFGSEVADMVDLAGMGAFITPTLTVAPCLGNPMPRTVEVSAGLLHATGLPNPGLEVFLAETLPALQALPCPVIVSIAGADREEWHHLATALSEREGILALELNLTPPMLLQATSPPPLLPSEAELCQSLRDAVTTVRAATSLPLIAKLPSVGLEVGSSAKIAVGAGADIVAVGQAFPGVAVRSRTGNFRLPGVVGGVSGPCIKPLALYQVWQVARTVSVPIFGGGGVMNAEDALEFLLTGASAVTIGIANLIHPRLLSRLPQDLACLLQEKALGSRQ